MWVVASYAIKFITVAMEWIRLERFGGFGGHVDIDGGTGDIFIFDRFSGEIA